MKNLLILATLMFSLLSCTKEIDKDAHMIVESTFDNGFDGWIAGFADYPVGEEAFYELQSMHTTLPAPLNVADGAVFISGNNHSDDLFMFLKKEISGLKKNTSYSAKFYIELASNAPSSWVGAGGAPGESVYLGIGVSATEPDRVVENGYYRMNIEKGNQASGGNYRNVIGNIANGTNEEKYVLLEKEGDFSFTTVDNETVWAMVSTDSGFEATTALYYAKIRIEFYEVN